MTLDELAHVVQAAFDGEHVDKDQMPCIGCTAAARAVLLAVADYIEPGGSDMYLDTGMIHRRGALMNVVHELRRIAGEG